MKVIINVTQEHINQSKMNKLLERIEFLEKALNDATATASIDSNNTTIFKNLLSKDSCPELHQYIQEKIKL